MQVFDLPVRLISRLNLVGEHASLPSIAYRFHALTCVEWSSRLAAVSWTVLSLRSTLSTTAALNLSEKCHRFVILASIIKVGYTSARCPILPDHFNNTVFSLTPSVQKTACINNAIESLNRIIRKTLSQRQLCNRRRSNQANLSRNF